MEPDRGRDRRRGHAPVLLTRVIASSSERYDPQIAERMLTLGDQMTRLPQYLGVTLLRFEPGQLWAPS